MCLPQIPGVSELISCIFFFIFIKIILLWQVLDFPGGRVMFTYQLKFISESPEKRADCFRVLDDNGQPIAGDYIELVTSSKFKVFLMPFIQTIVWSHWRACELKSAPILHDIELIENWKTQILSRLVFHEENDLVRKYNKKKIDVTLIRL